MTDGMHEFTDNENPPSRPSRPSRRRGAVMADVAKLAGVSVSRDDAAQAVKAELVHG
jgi:hypothetical protein